MKINPIHIVCTLLDPILKDIDEIDNQLDHLNKSKIEIISEYLKLFKLDLNIDNNTI